MENEKQRTLRKTWIIIIALGISLAAMGYIFMSIQQFNQVFTKGVAVENIAIGGLTKEQAFSLIEDKLQVELQHQCVTITDGKSSYAIPLSKLGGHYQIDETLDSAFEVGHDGNGLRKYYYAKKGLPSVQNFEVPYSVVNSQIENILIPYAKAFYTAPIDATIARKNKQFIITPEVLGKEVDISLLVNAIKNTIREENYNLPIQVTTKDIVPIHTTETLSAIQTPISSFYTSYNNADRSRNINLKVAAGKINDVLAAGETFFLSKHLEPISFAEGYKEAKVIVNGRIEEGIGGGVCQIASTLYNAILLSNLEIVSRQNHSLPVAYVPLGRDATYTSDGIDFIFKNTSQYPVFIESYCEENKIYVNIFSHESLKPLGNEIKFQSEILEVIAPPATQYIEDATLIKGTELQELTPLEGKKVKLYKLYYEDENLIKKEVVDTSYYKPRSEVIKIGIKESPASSEEDTPLEEIEDPLGLGGFLDLDILMPSDA